MLIEPRGGPWRKVHEKRRRRQIATFLADSDGQYHQPYTRSKRFGWELLQDAMRRTDADPAAGRQAARTAADFFERVSGDLARSRERRAEAPCQRLQALGIMAAADRALGRPEKAERNLRRYLRKTRCRACKADLQRRLAIVLRYQRRFGEALEEMVKAMESYRELDSSGHDLDQNGLASCLYGRATIRFFTGDAMAATEDAARALSYGGRGERWYRWLPEEVRATLSQAATLAREGREREAWSLIRRLRSTAAVAEMPDLLPDLKE